MSPRYLFSVVLVAAFSGCSPRSTTNESLHEHAWPQSLNQDESSRCKQVGIRAAESPEMWERFKLKRLTSEPLKLDTAHADAYALAPEYSQITVTIPSGGHFGWHNTYIGIELIRSNYEVIQMYENYRR